MRCGRGKNMKRTSQQADIMSKQRLEQFSVWVTERLTKQRLLFHVKNIEPHVLCHDHSLNVWTYLRYPAQVPKGALITGAVHLFNLLTHHNSSALAVRTQARSSRFKEHQQKQEVVLFTIKIKLHIFQQKYINLHSRYRYLFILSLTCDPCSSAYPIQGGGLGERPTCHRVSPGQDAHRSRTRVVKKILEESARSLG